MDVVQKFCEFCQRWTTGAHSHPGVDLLGDIRDQNAEILRMLRKLMSNTEDLSAEIVELASALDALTTRVADLPTEGDVTQDQLDSLRTAITRVNDLAQAAPEVPTDGGGATPVDPSTPVTGDDGDLPVGS